jgi:hypothetical protein
MDPEERFSGQKRLRQDIESHEVYKIMKRYSDQAPEKGPGGLILARKHWLL